jgi:hypothetical protein
MKLYQIIISLLAVAVFGLLFNKYVAPKIPIKNSYAQKFEYKDTKRIAGLKNEVETLRVKALRLQAALDSCVYDIKEEVTVAPKVIYKAKKTTKALDDCSKELMEIKAKLGEYIGAKAQMEVEKDLQINLLKRQMDTCAYFVQEMDKALLKMSNDVTTLTNERDSLSQKLLEPVSVATSFPCLKTKRGIVVTAKHQIIPGDERPAIHISLVENSKQDHKATKKSCKKK